MFIVDCTSKLAPKREVQVKTASAQQAIADAQTIYKLAFGVTPECTLKKTGSA